RLRVALLPDQMPARGPRGRRAPDEPGRADQGVDGTVLGQAAPHRAGVRDVLALRGHHLDLRVLVPLPLGPHLMAQRLQAQINRGGLPMWLAITIGIWAWTI